MPKKIVNWTIGSFFRTIGRIVAYTLIGCGVGFLLNKLNLVSFLDIVNASENLSYTRAWLDVQQCKQRFIQNNESMTYREELYNCTWDSTNIGTSNSLRFGSDNGHLRKIEFNISDSGYYYPGNYVIYFKWGIDPRNRTNLNKYTINVYLYDGNKEIESGGVRCTYGVGSGNFESTTVCQFSSLYNFDRVMVQYYWQEQDNLVDSNNALNNTNAMSFNSIEYFTYDDNPTNAINSQTDIIKDEFSNTNDKIDNVNNSLNDLNDSINDTTPPDLSDFDNIVGYLPPGPVDSILTLPLSILNSLNGALNSSTCPVLHIPIPFIGGFLDIPCLSTIFSQIEGLTLFWESIGATLGGLLLYKYFCTLYVWIDDVTSLKHNHARLFGAVNEANAWGGAVDDV